MCPVCVNWHNSCDCRGERDCNWPDTVFLLVWEEGENDSANCCSSTVGNPCRSDQSLHGHLQQNGGCFHRPLCLFLYFYLLPWTHSVFWFWSTVMAVELNTVVTLKLSGLYSFNVCLCRQISNSLKFSPGRLLEGALNSVMLGKEGQGPRLPVVLVQFIQILCLPVAGGWTGCKCQWMICLL